MTEINQDSHHIPVTLEELNKLGWDQPDIILVSGDAYVDHPSFGTAVMARIAEHYGFRVAVLPQPNWKDDLRDFRKLGVPKYFFGVTAGAMDSMVNHYTPRRRRRSDDAYTPGGRSGYRPDMPSIIYTQILKKLYPEVPVVLGGVEASMRRFSHYDYWQDKVRPSILSESGADLLIYGMGERPFVRILELMQRGVPLKSLHNVLQTAFRWPEGKELPPLKKVAAKTLPSHNDCISDKQAFAKAFKTFEEESNRWSGDRLIQRSGDFLVVMNPPYPPADQKVADLPYDLPYTRLPHPKYRKKPPIPAYEMIRHSVTAHRGCFGGCSFCAIASHQGKFVVSRSKRSIIREMEKIASLPDFKGHITDMGGPSANMYKMGGIDLSVCKKCKRASCIFPETCKNLNYDHKPLLQLYDAVMQVGGVRKLTIGSGLRVDMLVGKAKEPTARYALNEYLQRVIRHHVSGRLKVAPEHTEDHVLRGMRKPSFKSFQLFYSKFRKQCREENLPWQLIPYFISGYPGSGDKDMLALAQLVQKMGLQTDQVQEFTPTPMTLATMIYHTGFDPYTGKSVYVAKTDAQKVKQKSYFFKEKGGKAGSRVVKKPTYQR